MTQVLIRDIPVTDLQGIVAKQSPCEVRLGAIDEEILKRSDRPLRIGVLWSIDVDYLHVNASEHRLLFRTQRRK